MKSKKSATAISAITETSFGSITSPAALRVLDDDAFEQVGDVLAAVGRGLEEVEDLLPLDHRDRIALVVEQLDDRILVDAVGLVFELADARRKLQHAFAPLEQRERLVHAIDGIADDVDQPLRARLHLLNL